ncbi:MAG: hypothetical protein GY899_14020 [Verrucomicrobiaceae bacterium]|nr:hypothetical protein [Verrucomicrobiaceae bacterium]
MTQEDKDFEASLRELSPAEVPGALQSQILESLETAYEEGRQPTVVAGTISKFRFLRPLAVAAAILIAATGVFFAVLNNLDTHPGTPPGTMAMTSNKVPFVPVHAENIFEGVEDEGLFLTGEKMPVHGVRYRFSDSFKWENPEDGSIIKMTIPSERLYLLPVRTD